MGTYVYYIFNFDLYYQTQCNSQNNYFHDLLVISESVGNDDN